MAKTVKKGGSKMFWIIGSIVLIAGGIGVYFLLRKKKGAENTNLDTPYNVDNKDSTIISNTITVSAPDELNSTDKIKAFQDWMDEQGKGWIKKDGKWVLLNKGKGYGIYGKNTDAVWKVYGKDYLKSLESKPSVNKQSTPSKPSKPNPDIDVIIKNATGFRTERQILEKGFDEKFIKAWADAIRNKKTAFIWSKIVYRTKTGDELLSKNIIDKTFYTKIDGAIAKLKASDDADAYYVKKGINLGKAKGVEFNNGLWLYFPDSGYLYKWYKADYVTTINPKSSNFEGITDEIEFENNLSLDL